MSIRVALFGQPRVLSTDGSVEFPLPRKTLNVLAYLILHRNRPPSRDTIAFALFPDEEEERARGSLRRNLSYLLAALPDGKRYVSADGERIGWNLEAPAHVDVVAFERAIREGRDGDAVGEYAGALLPTLYDEWTTADRERLRDAFHEALVRTIARERSNRRFEAATALAHRLLDEDPWREDVVRQLIAIRYEAGDRAGALASFERFAERLRDEMQADPMAETVAVRDAVLRGARLATSESRPSSASPSDPALPFVGRDAAMNTARESWHAAADGRAGVLLVAGEAGSGKTRFVTELARLVESEGGRVVRGYTAAGGENRPYEAFVEALHDAPALLDAYADAVLTDDRAARVRLFDSVRLRLSNLAQARPLAIVLEDLHWAGAATIALFEYVADRLERAPVFIIATFRDVELARAHPLRALRRQFQSRRSTAELVLERLSAGDAMVAARAASPEGTDDEALARAVEWSGGVPLLLAEALRDLSAGRRSEAADIAGLVGERFARLSEQAESALTFGAVLGERFDLDVLAAVTGWREHEIVEAVGETIEFGLVRATSRSPGLAFAFTHDLIRVAAVERIPLPDRVRAHGLVARVLAGLPDAAGSRAAEIAKHFAAAGNRERASRSWRDAARYALDVFANHDAREAATAGLALCEGDGPEPKALRYELLGLREQSLARIGELESRRADAERLVELAEDDARKTEALGRFFEAYREDASMRARALTGLSALAARYTGAVAAHEYAVAKDAFIGAEYPRARDAALRAAEALAAGGATRDAFNARCLHINVLARLGAFDEAADTIERLRAIVEADDDLAMRAEFYRVASTAANDERREVAIADARRSLELALRIGDRSAEARARHNVAALVGKLGRYEEAEHENRRAIGAYEEVGDAISSCDATLNLASVRVFCGDCSGAERLLAGIDTIAMSRPWTALRCILLRGIIARRRGSWDLAINFFLDALNLSVEVAAAFYAVRARLELASAYARAGRSGEARDELDRTLSELAPIGQPSILSEAFAFSARLFAGAGAMGPAREHAEKAEGLTVGIVVQSYSEVAWSLGATYALLGEAEKAMEFANACVVSGVRDALNMPADLSEAYLALPWHRHASAFLWGRPVPLRLEEEEETQAVRP